MTTSISGSGAVPGAVSPTPVLSSSQLDASAFLKLLITEIKNQDPTQPMDNTQMITQLAQMNQTQNTQQMLTTQQETFAASMLGKTVTGAESTGIVTGTATSFVVDGSTINLMVNGQPMSVSSVTQVAPEVGTSTPPPSTPTPPTNGATNA